MKKTFLFLCFALLSFCCAKAQTATAPSGSGTSSDPYLIENLNNLYWVTQNTSSWTAGKYFKQTADIDASASSKWANGAGFTTIGNGTTTFAGNYDGQGFAISGVFINLPTTDNVGFFGKISGALTIQNMNLVNIHITGQGNVGGLVGSKWDGSTNNSIISNCSTTGTVVGTGNSVGGMFGCIGSCAAVNINRCFSTCTVSTTSASGKYYGGMAGYVKGYNSTYPIVFTNCYASGKVSGNGATGGFIGWTNKNNAVGSWSTTNCYSSGIVSIYGVSAGNIGGFIGLNGDVNGKATNCFWDTQVSGQSTSAGGTGKTTAEMTTHSTYTSWDFADETVNGANDFWGLTAGINGGYPILTWQCPVTKKADNITSTSFTANWKVVPVTNWTPSPTITYKLDVATDAAFSSILSGYNNLSVSGTSQVVSGLSAGNTYYYRIRYSYNGLSSSASSNITTIATTPVAPVATDATNINSSGFTANWNTLPGITKYQLDVATDAEFTTIVYTNPLVTGSSYAVIGLKTNTPYYYRVRTGSEEGTFSTNSNIISTKTLAGLAIPVATAAGNIGTSGFTANWIASTGAVGYQLDVATDNAFANLVLGYNKLVVAGTSQVVTGLSVGSTYYYRVRANNGSTTSENSNIITITTTPAAPTANAATAITTSGFVANWASVASATGYLLDVATDSVFTTFVSGYQSKSVSGTSQAVTGLSAGKTYYYCVRATNGNVSNNSNTITVATTEVYATIPFASFPVYAGGTVSPIYNSGPGMAVDQTSTTTEDSKMVVINATDESKFTTYIQSLLNNGFTQISTNRIDSNLFYTLRNGTKLYYLYYAAGKKQVRIIQDNSTRTMLTELDASTQGTGKTEFYLYSLDYTHGEGQTSTTDYWKIDCGAMIIVKLADNSLFVIDGGHERQSSNAALEGLLNFMYKITGQEEGTTLNIRAWFFSHAHGDHVYMTYPFLEKYHEVLNLESVLFNIPSFQVMSGGYDAGTFLMKKAINTYYPNCKFVKLHTGQHFSLQGVSFDVLFTHEDGVSETGVNTIGNFNDTSTILEMIMDGKKIMLLGDTDGVGQSNMLSMFSEATLKSDCVQTTHHGYNDVTSLYSVIKAPLALYCNSTVNAKDNNMSKYLGVINATSNVKVLYADPYTYKITVENGSFKSVTVPSYRSYFKTVSLPNLSVGTITTSGNQVALNTVLDKTSLTSQLIDKSIIGTPGNITESCSLILDGKTATKFCSTTIPATFAWTMKNPVILKWYTIYTAGDNATNTGRNPQKWVLCGSNNGTTWMSIDSVNNPKLPDTNLTGTAFTVSNPKPYQYYALKVFSTAGSNIIQFSELGLYGEMLPTDISKNANSNDQNVEISTNANNQISVNNHGGLSKGASVSVYNTLGQKLVSKQITSDNTLITMSVSGIYIVVVQNAQANITKKIRLN